MALAGLTKNQARVARLIHAAGPVAPTYTELMAEIGTRSRASINWYICKLVERGWLAEMPRGRPRSLALTAEARAALDRERG